MIFPDFELNAYPYFARVKCPEHGDEMQQIGNGFLSILWYCKLCDRVYTLKLAKMKENQIDREALRKEIELLDSKNQHGN